MKNRVSGFLHRKKIETRELRKAWQKTDWRKSVKDQKMIREKVFASSVQKSFMNRIESHLMKTYDRSRYKENLL